MRSLLPEGGPLADRRAGRWILREALPSLSSEDSFKRTGTPVFIGHCDVPDAVLICFPHFP